VRVVHHDGDLPPLTFAEAQALRLIGAPPSLRLACQTRPACDLEIHPVLQPYVQLPIAAARGNRFGLAGFVPAWSDFGREREVTVLFVDVRGSTALAETRMPYDVVFLINQFMAEMAAAVEGSGGHYSNFTGDGLMALFGLGSPSAAWSGKDHGARSALFCAAEMLERVERMNVRLHCELATPLCVGIGIHSGLAIIGRMGPPKMPIVTALGDTVNTASRLEGLAKELSSPLVASARTIELARVATPLRDVQLRGRESALRVATFDDAKAIRQVLSGSPDAVAARG
jgi:adenylate cyclase